MAQSSLFLFLPHLSPLRLRSNEEVQRHAIMRPCKIIMRLIATHTTRRLRAPG